MVEVSPGMAASAAVPKGTGSGDRAAPDLGVLAAEAPGVVLSEGVALTSVVL